MQNLIWLILGLIIFLGGHYFSRMRGLRDQVIASKGVNFYRAVYSIVALMGLALIVHGYGAYRAAGYIPVWNPPRFFSHIAVLLVWPAFILVLAAYLPGEIKRRAKHPMLLAVKIWASAHLLANGDLGSILLFGSILAWAVATRIALKRAEGGAVAPAGEGFGRNDWIAIGLGSVLALVFMLWLHRPLIGVGVFG